ncbi:hypothetical protein [Tenuifilum thalassicum]|uniref:Uncharacterized protein n=1 Tax=Tenuifilum thalassicum TaxID=2590900 RepID=A0A7D3XIK8_9BACT|nr:hypothetical protein [Tenuifilum thalassicum]QKG81017.1 hypothetical protein FHG85_12335 [Tenuifilum thalassicum]
MRIKLLIIFLVTFKFCDGQNIENTFWTDCDNFFKIYQKKKVIDVNIYDDAIHHYILYYGFYDSCEITSLNDLKRKGKYYFEVFTSEEITGQDCAELFINKYETDTLMTIYYSSSQKYFTYKKINSLPENVIKYLEEKGIEINMLKK